MEITNMFEIGSYFNKDNIFLGTIIDPSAVTHDFFMKKFSRDIPEEYKPSLSSLIDDGYISTEDYDVFYKDFRGYVRFSLEHGEEVIAGDNTDNKGIITNLVSAWEYFDENDIVEAILDDSVLVLCVKNVKPLEHYNFDYNINPKNKE